MTPSDRAALLEIAKLIVAAMEEKPIVCSVEKYGPYNQKCNRLAKWIFTGDNKPYCGIHARQFLKRALRPIWQGVKADSDPRP